MNFARLFFIFSVLFFYSIQAYSEEAAPISDNSFVIEEAYNQEEGVVQHIGTWEWAHGDRSSLFQFTQEWPLLSMSHQFAYVIPIANLSDPDESGIGDISLSYRYQLMNTETVSIAPNFMLGVPTGDRKEGLGIGTNSFGFKLPVSWKMNEKWVSHWNGGVTVSPGEQDISGESDTTVGMLYGASFIYLYRPTLNFIVEVFGENLGSPIDGEERENSLLINPGARYAFNFPSGLQIVPGLSFPIGVGPSSGEWGVFTYLSIEHGFS